MIRVIVTGSRHAKVHHGEVILQHLRDLPREFGVLPEEITIVHGGADGVDTLAGHIARYLHMRVAAWPVDWNAARKVLGQRWRFAGPLRNAWMLHAAPTRLVLGFPLLGSKGTWDMVRPARAAGVETRIVEMVP